MWCGVPYGGSLSFAVRDDLSGVRVSAAFFTASLRSACSVSTRTSVPDKLRPTALRCGRNFSREESRMTLLTSIKYLLCLALMPGVGAILLREPASRFDTTRLWKRQEEQE